MAVNGPAVGGATTAMLLCDAVVSVPSATFHTTFKQLGITPEGCSTLTFKSKMGPAGARRMLAEGEKLSAAEAARLGFVDVLLGEGEDVVAAACDHAWAWVAAGRGRVCVEGGLVKGQDEHNKLKGQQLADAVLFGVPFMRASLGLPEILARALSPVLRTIVSRL